MEKCYQFLLFYFSLRSVLRHATVGSKHCKKSNQFLLYLFFTRTITSRIQLPYTAYNRSAQSIKDPSWDNRCSILISYMGVFRSLCGDLLSFNAFILFITSDNLSTRSFLEWSPASRGLIVTILLSISLAPTTKMKFQRAS